MFTKAEFVLSAAKSDQFPKLLDINGKKLSEIAIVGRSNVGKSSLLNHLVQNKRLANISSKPGKTQLINFFSLDQKIALVDLPGYGFAKVSKSTREKWGDLIQDYLRNRETLSLILLLCDIRHPPTNDDIAFTQWAIHYQKPLLIIFTKADKLNKGDVERYCNNRFISLSNSIDFNESSFKSISYLPYSIKDAKGRTALIKEIEKRIQ